MARAIARRTFGSAKGFAPVLIPRNETSYDGRRRTARFGSDRTAARLDGAMSSDTETPAERSSATRAVSSRIARQTSVPTYGNVPPPASRLHYGGLSRS